MSFGAAVRRFPQSSPYWPVLTQGVLRRALSTIAVGVIAAGLSAWQRATRPHGGGGA